MTETRKSSINPPSLMDVGGYRLAVSATGTGTPPVVFVSCLGAARTVWDQVLGELSPHVSAVTYDRPGLGESDPLPERLRKLPRTYGWAADQLRDLLDDAGVCTPRVLVGHSIGGLIVEAYATSQPGDVAGLVFVDATVIDLFREFDDYTGIKVDGEGGGVRFDHETSLTDHLTAGPLPQVPSIVLTAAVGRWLRYTDIEQYQPFTDNMAELDRRWQQGQADLNVRVHGMQVIAGKADHHLNLEAPKLVAATIEAVVRATRERGMPHLDAGALADADGYLADDETKRG